MAIFHDGSVKLAGSRKVSNIFISGTRLHPHWYLHNGTQYILSGTNFGAVARRGRQISMSFSDKRAVPLGITSG